LYQLSSFFISSIGTPLLIPDFLILAIGPKSVFEKCCAFVVFAAGGTGVD
jgi:hypothetical protein